MMPFETDLFDAPLFEASPMPPMPPRKSSAATADDAVTASSFRVPIKYPKSVEPHGINW